MISKDIFRKIYTMLDKVDPVPFDCGEICGAACCRPDSFDIGDEPYLYLLPGEKEYLEEEGTDIKITRESSKEHDLPGSYGEYVYTAYCKEPRSCDRRFRPIQCRSFPLWPYITEDGELLLSFYNDELPYVCPLIEERRVLSEEFVRATYEAWEILIEDESIRDLILADSRRSRDI